MDSRQIQQIILNKTFTRPDYIRRVNFIREYLENRFFKGFQGDFSAFLEEEKASRHDRNALTLLDEHFFNLFTRDNMYPVINSLTAGLKSLPLLTVYIPVIIDENLINEIGLWFRKNLHPELIMEVHCKPSLVSGLAYVWNSRYHDLSLHEYLGKKEDFVNNIINEYAKNQL